jgi:hypothetical protein
MRLVTLPRVCRVEYYHVVQIDSKAWPDSASGVFGAIDLYGNEASSVYYDDMVVR